jgi:plasmid segregation protein ParM
MLADIGNVTMNTLVITNGRPVSDKKYTDKIGVQQCVKSIMNEVQAECGKVPDESVIEDFLINGTAEVSERIQTVMRKEAIKYTEMIFDKLSEYEYDPELVKLHIIGGGGCLIRNFGKYDASSVEIIDDICATAKGYEELYNAQHQLRKGA